MQVISQDNVIFLDRAYTNCMQRGRKPAKEAPFFGKQLAAYRKQKGLTQYEFANELGISRNLVLHYERSCPNPNMEFVIKAAKTLDISTDELLGIKAAKKEKPGPPPRIKKLTEKITQLPKTKQGFVLDMIEGYIDKAS